MNAAFVGDPQDVRSWPVLDPLAPHALAVARRADEAGIAEPTARLFNQLGVAASTRRRATPRPSRSMRRALAIDEASYGPDHPEVAIRLNNLAQLLQATNRLAEAEPLYRRALAIDEASYGPDHPDVAIGLNNLAQLLQATNRLAEAEPLYAPRARDRRDEPTARIIPTWRPTSTISRTCFKPRTASPRPSR